MHDFDFLKLWELKIQSKVKQAEKNAQVSMHPRVNFGKAAYPGVTVHVGEQVYSIQEKLDGPKAIVYSFETKEFDITSFEPIVCELSDANLTSEDDNHDEWWLKDTWANE